jgi:putative acetyltransferase
MGSARSAEMLELRKAVADDIAQIWAVRTLAIKAGCRGHYSDDDVQRWANVTVNSDFPKIVAGTKFYVIADGSLIAGFGFLDPATSEVGGMFVQPQFHGQGLGRRILSALEEEAKRAELKFLWLVSTLNAEPFYASAGFKSQGRSKWNHPNGFELDCVNMSKELSS